MKIIAQFKGGVGNQLFIYAFARSLQVRVGAELEFDLHSGFKSDRYRQKFWLLPFRLNIAGTCAWESFDHPFGKLRRKFVRFSEARRPLIHRRYIIDPGTYYNAAIANLDSDDVVYFDGYWESFRYFEDHESLLHAELQMEAPRERENLELAASIGECDAIAVHARRLKGVPNVSGARPNAEHPQLSLDYYLGAVEEIARHCRNPRVFCFSDYPEWFLEHFKPSVPVTFVAHNHHGGDASSWKDLWLMRQCRHFVIANSSFSWWGAWLAESPDKIVIYPEPVSWTWIRNMDMMPAGWRGQPA